MVAKIRRTTNFCNHILKQIDTPLVLAFDEVNYIFEHPQVAKDVLPLFRSWYEEGKRERIWEKLRLIIVH
jgi:Cdc6-like AAA superfamily ATPase